jgi:exoribonuclease-2
LDEDRLEDELSGDAELRALLRLAQALRLQRYERGAAVVPAVDVRPRLVDGRVVLRRTEPFAASRLVEEELAILANRLAGDWCGQREIPAIYRAEKRCGQRLTRPDLADPVAAYRQLRHMPRAGLQAEPAPHHGVGADRYAPVTEPCRRVTDLVMHWQLASACAGEPVPFAGDELGQILLETALARRVAREIRGNARRYWLYRYLEPFVGQHLPGVILDTFASDYLVLLSETGLRLTCPMRSTSTLPPGTPVDVLLAKVSARSDVLRAASLRPNTDR